MSQALDRVGEATEHLLEVVKRMETSQHKVESEFAALLKVLDGEIREGQPSLDVDEVLEFLNANEERLKASMLPNIKETERILREVIFKLPPEIRGRALHVHKRRLANMYRALEFMRDARWQMMSLRADRDRAEVGPTFEDAGALERYLDEI